jgi:hypothetical protein
MLPESHQMMQERHSSKDLRGLENLISTPERDLLRQIPGASVRRFGAPTQLG